MIGLIRLLQDIINHNIPSSVQPHLLAARLVALKKPTGGFRPIAVGELFYRIAAIIAVRRVKTIAADLFAPYQFGVGVPNGCEKIIHSLQHALTDNAERQAVLQLDISNAFNSCDRTKLLAMLYNTPELAPIWRMATFSYATTSLLLLQRCPGQHITSSNGVRQGDPLSRWKYAMCDLVVLIRSVRGGRICCSRSNAHTNRSGVPSTCRSSMNP